jgi:hypothetical protein
MLLTDSFLAFWVPNVFENDAQFQVGRVMLVIVRHRFWHKNAHLLLSASTRVCALETLRWDISNHDFPIVICLNANPFRRHPQHCGADRKDVIAAWDPLPPNDLVSRFPSCFCSLHGLVLPTRLVHPPSWLNWPVTRGALNGTVQCAKDRKYDDLPRSQFGVPSPQSFPNPLLKSFIGPHSVEILHVPADRPLQLPLTDNQHRIGAFAAHTTGEPFANRMCAWGAIRGSPQAPAG